MEGYAKVASFMSHHAELGILRRFGRLNLRNLLYLQAQLTHLEKELAELVDHDNDKSGRAMYCKNWGSLAECEDNDPNKEQWGKVLEIRKTLKEYNREFAQQIFLGGQKGPNAYDLKFFQSWLERPKMGDFPLRGLDEESWSSENAYDLLALQNHESRDPFSRWLTYTFVPFFHNLIGNRFKNPLEDCPEAEICQYSETHLSSVVNVLGIVAASVVPIASIVVLYFITDVLTRLGLTIVFTAIFSSCLALMTRARRVEIFAASSAFAAVQVVFVTGNN